MSTKSIVIWVIVVAIVAILIVMFAQGNFGSNLGQVATSTAEAPSAGVILNNLASTSATTTKPQSRIIEMTAKPFSFLPNAITVNSGDLLELRITTSGGLAHNFSIDEFGINEPLPNDQTTTIRFTPMKPGVYTFYCAVPGHREKGMTGTLTVK